MASSVIWLGGGGGILFTSTLLQQNTNVSTISMRVAEEVAGDGGYLIVGSQRTLPVPGDSWDNEIEKGIALMFAVMLAEAAGEIPGEPIELPEHPAPPIPANPADAPGQDWEWRGSGEPGSRRGSWYHPETDQSIHPDLDHPDPIGPHWDWKDPSGKSWRIDPDGNITPK